MNSLNSKNQCKTKYIIVKHDEINSIKAMSYITKYDCVRQKDNEMIDHLSG